MPRQLPFLAAIFLMLGCLDGNSTPSEPHDSITPTAQLGIHSASTKVSICHRTGRGIVYQLITIGAPAVTAHRTHGDGAPGEAVPGLDDFLFDENCQPVEAGPMCVPPPPDMVSWWPGDGTAEDLLGGNDGSIHAGTSFAAGLVSQAFVFNGTSGSVQVPDVSSLDLTTEFTFDAWINPSSLQSDPAKGGVISKVGGGGGNNGYQFGITANNSRLYCLFNAAGEPWPGPNFVSTPVDTIPVGDWTHIACTYDNANLDLYVNGLLVSSTFVGSKSVVNSTSTLRISGDDNLNVFFHGLIDEVEIYNRALTAAEVLAIFEAGIFGKCKS